MRVLRELMRASSCIANSGSEMNPLLTKQQASRYLQCTARFLERMVRFGRLRALKPSRKLVRFRRADLDAFLDSGATIGGDSNEKSKRNSGREETGQ